MINLGLELFFWFILVVYIGALIQSKKGLKQQH